MADTPVAVAVAVAATTCLCLAARPSLTTYSCGPTDRFDARGFSTVNSIHLQRLQNTHHALCARYYNRLLRGLTVFNFDRPFRQSSENSCCCAALLGSISVSDRCCTRVVDGGSHLSSIQHYIHAYYYIVQVRGRGPFHFRVSVLSNQVCGACSHASWPTGRRGPGLNSFTCKRVSASATQPKPIQPMDAPTTIPIPIPHAHMTSPLHCS